MRQTLFWGPWWSTTPSWRRSAPKRIPAGAPLPLIAPAEDYLLRLRAEQEEVAAYLGEGYIQNEFICKQAGGKPFYPNYITGLAQQIGQYLVNVDPKQHLAPGIKNANPLIHKEFAWLRI